MATAKFIKKAQKNIYEHGKYVEYKSLKGKRAGQTLTKLDRTIPRDQNDKIMIAVGESYYTWKFMKGGQHFSKTAPRRSQLTQSSYLSTLYDIEDRVSEFSCDEPGELESFRDEIQSEVESLKEETEDALDRIPDQLKEAPVGCMLDERIQALDSAISELESIDCDYEELDRDELLEEIASETGIDTDEEGWEEKISDDEYITKKNEKLQEWINEKIEELNGISFQ